MSDLLASERARNAQKQALWRKRHPEHREAHRIYMQQWRSKRKLIHRQRCIDLGSTPTPQESLQKQPAGNYL